MVEKLSAFLKRTRLDRFINPETLRYAFWGVVTTVINIGVYRLLLFAGVNYKLSDIVAVVTAKVAAFFVNKYFVFRVKTEGGRAQILEIFRYVYTRGFTMLVDYFGLILLVDVLGGDAKYMKYIVTVVVVIINYLFGKFLVFRKRDDAVASKEEAQ